MSLFQVRPFDGHSYDYEADKCFAAAVRDRRNDRSPVVLTGIESDTLVAHIRFISQQTTVAVRPNSLTVSGRKFCFYAIEIRFFQIIIVPNF